MCVHHCRKMVAVVLTLAAGVAGVSGGQESPPRGPALSAPAPASPHHGFLGGPWEILAKMGHEGTPIRLPLSIREEGKPQELGGVLPVMGTPVTIKVKRYLPNLAWETAAVADPDGGPVVKLSLRGGDLHQDFWLGGRDRERQSVSAPVGGVALRELPAGDAAGAAIGKLTEPGTVGILLVWLRETDAPLAYAVQPGASFTLPESDWTLTIPRYVPHYSIDRATKQITSLSEKPVNPAVEVCVMGAGREYRQWLWSQFALSPHKTGGLPFRARFLDFDLGGTAGQYILAVTQDRQAFALCLRDGKKRLERIETGRRYPFVDERYSFAVEEVRSGAAIVNTWKNNSDVLLRPAIVAAVAEGAEEREVVLELNNPCHHKTAQGTLVLLYRRIP